MTPDTASIEKEVQCPYCGECFATFIDPLEEKQIYVEDCYVCCRPIRFIVVCADEGIESLRVEQE